MLTIRDLAIEANGKALLSDISCEAVSGEILAIIGPNGAGKSSLLHGIIGDLRATSGTVEFAHRDLNTWPAHQRACHIALLPQLSLLNFPFTVDEVVMLGRTPHSSGRSVDRAIGKAACAATDVSHLRDRSYTQLSGGEKQRVQLARVMAQVWRGDDADDRLLLLDEPTASLDLGHQRLVMDALTTLARDGVTIVIVAHDISLAARYATQILALRDGHCVATGTPHTVINETTMRALFDAEIRVIEHPDTGHPVVLNA